MKEVASKASIDHLPQAASEQEQQKRKVRELIYQKRPDITLQQQHPRMTLFQSTPFSFNTRNDIKPLTPGPVHLASPGPMSLGSSLKTEIFNSELFNQTLPEHDKCHRSILNEEISEFSKVLKAAPSFLTIL